ncbi:substrate-binding domain-containing protein [Hydrogenophaga sp.]|uniref:substrate-binding domain-containing protein n=1 Tax=Hydrogenophaga sp. TaxID=1904254 RepID=UPI0035653346
MATRPVLAELARGFEALHGGQVAIEAVGGVDAFKRVQAGELFDLVVLASDAIDKLVAAGHLQAGSRVDLVRSGVAVAVPAGAERPDLGSEAAVRQAVLGARSIGYSTGPSGVALMQLFERWGIADTLKDRTVQARPGVPVGALVASGEVALGFQQLSELLNVEGIEVLGPLPPAIQINTVFSAGLPVHLVAGSPQAQQVKALLDFMNSPQAGEVKQRHGMTPA